MILAITLLALAAQTSPLQEPEPCDYIKQYMWDPKFTPGQKWIYYSRPSDIGSTITIAEIDDVPTLGFVVHIVVDNVNTLYVDHVSSTKTVNRIVPGGTEHFAIQRDSLASSVIQVVDNVPIPVLSYTYSNYRAHCVTLTYTTTVADTLTLMETIRAAKTQAKRCEQLAKTMTHPPPPCKPSVRPSDPPPTPTFPPMPTSAPLLTPPPAASPSPPNPKP